MKWTRVKIQAWLLFHKSNFFFKTETSSKILVEQSYGDYDDDYFRSTLRKSLPSHSASGILEFSPEKAGLDVMPANYNFPKVRPKTENSSLTGMIEQLKRSVTDLTFGNTFDFIVHSLSAKLNVIILGTLNIANAHTRSRPSIKEKEKHSPRLGENVETSNHSGSSLKSGDNLVEYVKSRMSNELNCSQERYDVLDRKLNEITG